jgi:hypothetical protein
MGTAGGRRLPAICAAFVLALAALSADAAPVLGRAVLALYKSSEGQSAKENEIVSFVEPVLRQMGFSVRYHDADAGVPDQAELAGARAVVSWFRGPSMRTPERYLAFVRETVDSGRKFVVLDNLGAYQERETGRWLESGELNLALSRFGLQYWGDWTDDPALVSIRGADTSVFRTQALASSGARLLFYRYQPIDRDIDVLLSVERRDRAYGPSPVAVANRNGAFVLSSYLTAYRNGAQELYVDFASLLRLAFFGRPREDRVAVLTDATKEDPQSVRLAERVLGVARIGFDTVRGTELPLLVPGDLARYTTVALALSAPEALGSGVLEDYLAGGGSVVSLGDALPAPLRSIASAEPAGGKAPEPAAVAGLRFGTALLPAEGFFLEDREVPWTAGTLLPPAGATSLAKDWLETVPLLWSIKTPAGGTVQVWNVREFWAPEHAGLLMESLLASRPVAACVTPALAAFRLDGFPRPLYDAVQKPLAVTDTEFFSTRFWPELRDLLGKRGIPVSASVIFTYNDRVAPPFWGGEMYMAERQASVELVRQLLGTGAEVGLFGYNHISLSSTLSAPNTRVWPSRTAMEEALRTVREEWKLLFGAHTLPTSYAAPFGSVSEDGVAALRAAFPELRVVGTSVAAGGISAAGFARLEAQGGVRVEPSSSSGYLFSDRTRRMMVSSVLGDGVWLHAVDADDLFDFAATGGKTWDELKSELDRVLAFQARHFPWLRFVRVSELARELDRLDDVQARFELRGSSGGVTTYVAELTPGTTFRLRCPGLKVRSVEGGEIVYAYARSDAAVLRAVSRRVVISLIRKA